MAYLDDDEDPPPDRPQLRHMSSIGYRMNPDSDDFQRRGLSLFRTRSTGHAPAPRVNVYNHVYQDADLSAESHSRPFAPVPPYRDKTPDLRVLQPGNGETGMAVSSSNVVEATVAECTRNVFGRFKAIKNLENDLSASWQETASDGLSRFQVWASNLGAYHDRQDPRSADSRLRKAPDVQKRIVRLLGDLLEDLHEIYEIMSGQREGEVEDADEADVPRNSDGEAEPRSEISELWLMVDNDVTTLMKVSILVQKNSVRNKLQHAVRAAEKISSSSMPTVWDRQRICHLYPKLEQKEWLLERLARITTQRRTFLMYVEGHSQRIAHDSSGNFASKSIFSRTTQALTQAPTLAPGQIKTAALERLDHFEDDDDMSDTSMTTRGSQLDGHDNVKDLNLVPLSSVCKDGKPGICPYCYDAVLFVGRRKRKLWRRHAFSDLMAYSCTFEFCDRVSFGSLTAWATHEKTEHLRDWHCPICNDKCGSRTLLMAHMSNSHPSSGETLSYSQINDASPPIETVAQCPFCDELEPSANITSLSTTQGSSSNQKSRKTDLYQRHLSHHMEQLALLAKSASVGDDEVNDDSDVEANSQATSLSSQGQTGYDEMDDAYRDVSIVPEGALSSLSSHGRIGSDEVEPFVAMPESELDFLSDEFNRSNGQQQSFDTQEPSSQGGHDSFGYLSRGLNPPADVEMPLQEPSSYRVEERNVTNTADYGHAPGLNANPNAKSSPQEDPMDLSSSNPNDLDPTAASTTDYEQPFKASANMSAQRPPLEGSIDSGDSKMEQVEREKRRAEDRQREDREWVEFDRRRKEKQEEEDREKKEAQAKLDKAMHKRLAETGFTQSQIDDIMDKQKAKKHHEPTRKTTTTTTTTRALAPLRSHVPVYAKIHTQYISTETLKYYDVPWTYDGNDPSYIILLREMDKLETDILFDHTKLLRSGGLLVDSSKGKKLADALHSQISQHDRGRSRARDGSEKREAEDV